jgi:peptide/nickel transport system substrate-binding protein
VPRRIYVSLAMLAVGGCLLTTAATAERRSSAVRKGGVFRIGAVLFDYVDPALAYRHLATIAAQEASCARLMTYRASSLHGNSRLRPEVASGFPKVSDDARTYTFTIRPGFRFSTGATVTAATYRYALNRVLNPSMQSVNAFFLEDIAGAAAVRQGRAKEASGIVARGNTLTIQLTKPAPDFVARTTLTSFCPLPVGFPSPPEGADAPIPGSGPYYIARFVHDREVVLKRNRFYGGKTPHHVDQFVFTLGETPRDTVPKIERNERDWTASSMQPALVAELASKYKINGSRFFVRPAPVVYFVVLNSARPLFRNNAPLRRAVNFAVDRKALVATFGPHMASATDQYLPPGIAGFRDAPIYPLARPNLARARALAHGHLRGRSAVLYVDDSAFKPDLLQAQTVKKNLNQIGLDVEIRPFPEDVFHTRLGTPGEPFDMAISGWALDYPDPSFLSLLFTGRRIGTTNDSRFNSARYNTALDRATRLTGAARERAYGRLDVSLAKNAAPVAAYAVTNVPTFISSRVGCISFHAYFLNITSVCLER